MWKVLRHDGLSKALVHLQPSMRFQLFTPPGTALTHRVGEAPNRSQQRGQASAQLTSHVAVGSSPSPS